jgi:hypothetical protein
MSLTFSKIYIKEEIFKDYKTEDNSEFISNLSRINFFIGATNSGKSRFLRNIFLNTKLKFEYNELNSRTINLLINSYNKKATDFINEFVNDGVSRQVKDIVLIKKVINHLTVGVDFHSDLLDNLSKVEQEVSRYNFTLKKILHKLKIRKS